MGRTALITGITGQDGSYLAEFLLAKGYQVYGFVRRLSSPNLSRIGQVLDRLTLLEGDLTDSTSLGAALQTSQPDEIYNLAAQSFVATSWNQPMLTSDVTGLGAVRLFEAARQFCRGARIYQASSSEMFGQSDGGLRNEETKFHPRSPYACAKVFAYHMAVMFRESYDMFVCNGILFNHESPRRGIEFVSRKTSDAVARIRHRLARELRLGNLEAKRDWGFAGDYVEAMWLMLQHERPDDYVIATGESHSVREFVACAFEEIGLNWEDYVAVDERFRRPADVAVLTGDYSKAKRLLGWTPKVRFRELVSMMVQADLVRVKAELVER
jgi:GDPmannose 4,6-dehydratase